MNELRREIDVWILKELRQLGVPLPKLKKIRLQIHKKNQKGKACGTFGVCLSRLLENDSPNRSSTEVPPFLEKMVCFLSNHLTRNCIFRKNGNKDRMTHLQVQLEEGSDLKDASVEDAAGVLKLWFRDLPVSLIPEEFHDLFISCHKACESTSSSKALLLACSLLPPEHLATLKYTLEFLASVAKQSALNKMSPQSLAIIFAPNIMPIINKCKLDKYVSIETLKEKQEISMNIVQWLIEHSEEVKNTPQSVEFLAQLSSQPSVKTSRNKTKRRKSMCDIVGVKIKKMVAPHADVSHHVPVKNTIVLKHKVECKSAHAIPAKRSKKQQGDTPLKVFYEKIDPSEYGETSDKIVIKVGASEQNTVPKEPIQTVCSSPSITETSTQFCPPQTKVIEDQNTNEDHSKDGPCLVEYNADMKTVITVNQSSENQTRVTAELQETLVTPSKEESEKSERPRSTLKRGKPNSVTSGLRDRRKGNLRCSMSLENLVTPFEKLQVSKRRSRSTSSVDTRNNEEETETVAASSIFQNTNSSKRIGEDLKIFFSRSVPHDHVNTDTLNTSNSSLSINRVLDFFSFDQEHLSPSNDLCNKNSVAADISQHQVLAASLGFSPILDFSQSSDSGNEHAGHETWSTVPSNVSRNPFEDITNTSEIPTLNSTAGDNSIFGSCEKLIDDHQFPNQKPVCKELFSTPSPITNRSGPNSHSKLSIMASSTPANDCRNVMWQDAATFGFQRNADDNVEGPKRESIIKLKETNAGKVLANVHLYNNKFSRNAPCFPRSPVLSKNLAFERNCLATKSVRERSKHFSEGHGFKVPRICPSSIKRVPQKSKLANVTKQVSVNTSFPEPVEESMKENQL